MNQRKEERRKERRKKGKSWKMDLFYTKLVAQTLLIKWKETKLRKKLILPNNIVSQFSLYWVSWKKKQPCRSLVSLQGHGFDSRAQAYVPYYTEKTGRMSKAEASDCAKGRSSPTRLEYKALLTRVSLLVVENSKKNVAARITACITKPSCSCTDWEHAQKAAYLAGQSARQSDTHLFIWYYCFSW